MSPPKVNKQSDFSKKKENVHFSRKFKGYK